jgi:hypothetical protein
MTNNIVTLGVLTAEFLLPIISSSMQFHSCQKKESWCRDRSGTQSKAIVALADGKTLKADLYVPETGMKPNTSFIDRELLISNGCLDTNANLRVEKAGLRVYAVSDVASCGRPAINNILSEIPVLGANIKRDLLLVAAKECSETTASSSKTLARRSWCRLERRNVSVSHRLSGS